MKLRPPEGAQLPEFLTSKGGKPGQGKPRPEPVPAFGGTEPWVPPASSREVEELPWEPPATSQKRKEPDFYQYGRKVPVEVTTSTGETTTSRAVVFL